MIVVLLKDMPKRLSRYLLRKDPLNPIIIKSLSIRKPTIMGWKYQIP